MPKMTQTRVGTRPPAAPAPAAIAGSVVSASLAIAGWAGSDSDAPALESSFVLAHSSVSPG